MASIDAKDREIRDSARDGAELALLRYRFATFPKMTNNKLRNVLAEEKAWPGTRGLGADARLLALLGRLRA